MLLFDFLTSFSAFSESAVFRFGTSYPKSRWKSRLRGVMIAQVFQSIRDNNRLFISANPVTVINEISQFFFIHYRLITSKGIPSGLISLRITLPTVVSTFSPSITTEISSWIFYFSLVIRHAHFCGGRKKAFLVRTWATVNGQFCPKAPFDVLGQPVGTALVLNLFPLL